MYDHREYPLPDPRVTPWLEATFRILALGVAKDLPVTRGNDDTRGDDAEQAEDQEK